MKTISLLSVLLYVTLSGCSGLSDSKDSTIVTPTQNKSLEAISPTNQTKKSGMMQNSLNGWLKTEWTPTVEKNETIKKMDENTSRDFTLQEYVNKAKVYVKEAPASTTPSQVEQMKSMPVIGK